jgi:hypothetical protein
VGLDTNAAPLFWIKARCSRSSCQRVRTRLERASSAAPNPRCRANASATTYIRVGPRCAPGRPVRLKGCVLDDAAHLAPGAPTMRPSSSQSASNRCKRRKRPRPCGGEAASPSCSTVRMPAGSSSWAIHARASLARCGHHVRGRETAAADARSAADRAYLHGTSQAAALKTPSHGLQRPQSSPRGLPRLCPVRAVDKERGPGRVKKRLRTGGKEVATAEARTAAREEVGERQDDAAVLREAVAARTDVERPLSASTDIASEVSVTGVLPAGRIGTKQQEAPKLSGLAHGRDGHIGQTEALASGT